MAGKQIGLNLVHYFMPLVTVKRKLDVLNADFKDVLKYYTNKPEDVLL
jgi:hypothetical protein